MSSDGWEHVEMDDEELNAIDPELTRRIMARHPDGYYINWEAGNQP